MNKPLITIITVSYNAVSNIEETIESVINQTYPYIEYIIIDGGSKDGTIDIIKKYEDRISNWISEPDKGIYDAMNKGIKLATGEWINFMNSGDTFFSMNTIEELFKKASYKSDIIYGNINLLLLSGEYIQKGDFVSKKEYMPFCHQASFSRTNLMKKYGFDTKYKICADRNFFYIAYINKAIFEYIDINVSNYEAEEGVSSVNMSEIFYEKGLIEGKTTQLSWKFKYYMFLCSQSTRKFFKKILPVKIVHKIKKYSAEHRFNKSI